MLAGVDRVVLLGHRARHVEQAQAHDLESLALEAAEDLADEPALDTIRLDENEGAFHLRAAAPWRTQARAARS